MPLAELGTGITVYYETHGAGTPLLLVMGTGADHSLWDVTHPAYSDRYHVITYDHRGTGQSTTPADPTTYTMRGLADDAVALLDALGIEAAHVSGLSLGSAVAQEIALNHPERILSAQLHCTWGRTDEWLHRLFDSMAFPVEHGDMAAFVRQAFMWVMSPAYLAERPDEVARIESAYLLENPHPPSPEGLLGHLHADHAHDTLDRLHEIDVPTLVTSGEMDWQVPTRYGRQVDERIPTSTMHVFEGPYSSHLAFTELADEFNVLTRAFLDAADA